MTFKHWFLSLLSPTKYWVERRLTNAIVNEAVRTAIPSIIVGVAGKVAASSLTFVKESTNAL